MPAHITVNAPFHAMVRPLFEVLRRGASLVSRWRSPAAQAEPELNWRVFNDSPDFISFCKVDGGYIDVNPAFEKFIGLSRHEIIGRTPLDIGLWSSPQERQAFVQEMRDQGCLISYHRQLMRSNGEVRDIEGWARIVDVGGEEVLLAIGRDETQRHAEEKELVKYRETLEQLVQLRTSELRESNTQLQAANNAKSSFLANMSHELRTPLNAVLGYAQILKMEPGLSPSMRSGLNTIEQGGQHLLALISDILDLARVEAGKLTLLPQPASLQALLDTVIAIMHVRAKEKALAFRFDPPSGLPPSVVIDEQRLRQILLNLLGNAVKFTDSGEISLRVDASPHGDRVRVRFEIRDTGVGIAPQDLARLFSPFEQVGDLRRRAAGAGLGLSISQALTRLMGGEIAVQSVPGKGSHFGFELDLDRADAAPAAVAATRCIAGYKGPRRRLLIVDDVAANRQLLVDLLRPLGFETQEAGDGLQVMETVEELRPDLILMDMMMPVMDGLEATRRLRAMTSRGAGRADRRPLDQVPIVAVSANASGRGIQECLSAGASAYLTKPIVASKLLECVGAQLDLEWLWRAA